MVSQEMPIKLVAWSRTFPRFLYLVATMGSSAMSSPKIRSMPADTTDELQCQRKQNMNSYKRNIWNNRF